MKKTIALLALSGIFLASCTQENTVIQENQAENTAPAKSNITLNDTKWDFPTFNAQLDFADGNFSTNAKCNNIFGSYEVSGDTLNFGTPGSTMMMCDPTTMKNEADLIAFLEKVETAELQEGNLILKTSDSELSLTPAKMTVFSDTDWKLQSILIDDAMVSHESFTDSSVEFTSDLGVYGTAICNKFTGEYTESEEEGHDITIGALGVTKKLCAGEEANKYESQILADLQNITTYEIYRNTLTLTNTDASIKLVYTAE